MKRWKRRSQGRRGKRRGARNRSLAFFWKNVDVFDSPGDSRRRASREEIRNFRSKNRQPWIRWRIPEDHRRSLSFFIPFFTRFERSKGDNADNSVERVKISRFVALFPSLLYPLPSFFVIQRARRIRGSRGMERARRCSFVGRKISAKPVTGPRGITTAWWKMRKTEIIQRDATRVPNSVG